MATVEETVRNSLLDYPTLFSNRTEIFHHLFCVIGNGYEWNDGELVNGYRMDDGLVEEYEREPCSVKDEEEQMKEYNEQYSKDLYEFLEPALRIQIRKDNAKFEFHKDNIDLLVKIVGNIDWIYPMCEYSRLMNIPDDVKDDWLEAAEQMATYVVSFSDIPGEKNTPSINRNSDKERKNNRELAELALQRIREIKESRNM